MIIRKATIDDLHLIAPLFDSYRMFYEQQADLHAATKFLKERILNNQSVIYLALSHNVTIGFVQLYPIFSSVSLCNAWLLNDLYVSDEGRNMGVGANLLFAAEELAKETGSKWLLLETAPDNIPAQKLYEKMGWSREEDFYYRKTISD